MTQHLSVILSNLHIDELNDMQKATLNPALDDEDIILLSPTGSGKTLAYLFPLLNRLTPNGTEVQALILAPSRELALQIDTVFKSMGTDWKICCCYGGHAIAEEKKSLLLNRPAIVVGTPGRIGDHLRKGNLLAGSIQTLIIDEFDKSLELGFQEEMEEIVSQLKGVKKRMLISATDMEEVPVFTGLAAPVKLNFLAGQSASRLQVYKVTSPAKDKIETLYRLLCTLGCQSSIVFCNHRESVERIYALLKEKGIYCEMFHGGMEQPDRERSLYKFSNGCSYTLVSTDLASRGLDIPQIEHIIHYHLPINEEAYIHRNGRTARWEASGTSYLILNEQEALPGYLPGTTEEFRLSHSIPKPAKPLWTSLYIGKGKKDKINKIDIAGFFYKKGKLSREDVGKVDVRERYSFVSVQSSKVKQLLNLVADEKIKGTKTLIEIAK